MSLDPFEALEDLIYEHQKAVIASEYGAMEADRANYGWGETELDDSLVVETKVYGPGMVLITTGQVNTIEFEDEWRSFGPDRWNPPSSPLEAFK